MIFPIIVIHDAFKINSDAFKLWYGFYPDFSHFFAQVVDTQTDTGEFDVQEVLDQGTRDHENKVANLIQHIKANVAKQGSPQPASFSITAPVGFDQPHIEDAVKRLKAKQKSGWDVTCAGRRICFLQNASPKV
jgi:hypothetical protein